jgi:hypothetical protein
LLAIPLYHYSIFTLGVPLVAFWGCLMVSGWAMGLAVSALVLRFGLGAESLAWVLICTLAGYFFGNFPVVKENFELVVVGIVVVSVLPIAWEMWAARRRDR